MESQEVLDIATESIVVFLKISAPIMVTALVVGILISLFQALTQIQETTLTFVPKMIAILIVLLLFMPFMLETLQTFADHLSERVSVTGMRPWRRRYKRFFQ